jgi:hypothetical protein
MSKETQADFGLLDTAAAAGNAERAQERGLYAPLAWASDTRGKGAEIVFRATSDTLKAPLQPQGLPTDPLARKRTPLFSGLLKYFPRALVAVSQCSYASNEQHNPGQPLHWVEGKSTDHEDCLLRHLADDVLGVKFDEAKLPDGTTVQVRHKTKVAWRALAALETELKKAGG